MADRAPLRSLAACYARNCKSGLCDVLKRDVVFGRKLESGSWVLVWLAHSEVNNKKNGSIRFHRVHPYQHLHPIEKSFGPDVYVPPVNALGAPVTEETE